MCTGHETSCEVAIHAIHNILEDENEESFLLVDTNNAFNSVYREMFLNNIFMFLYVRNYFIIPSRMFVIRGFKIST